MFVLCYNLLIKLYSTGIRIAALFNPKAKLWIEGRKMLIYNIEHQINNRQNWIWIHAASLGEFEQGRPLIEMLKERHPDHKILLTFFSPSGYEVRKGYPLADLVTYMPLDTRRNARKFISAVKPVLAVFIKYEIWYHHLAELQRQRIPTLLISAQLHKRQIYFRPWGAFLRKRLQDLDHIFVTSEAVSDFLSEKGFGNVSVAGDTRIDRVMHSTKNHKDFTWLAGCLSGRDILVAGSTWPKDEEILLPAISAANTALIIAPHEVHPARISALVARLPGRVYTLTEMTAAPRPCDCVVVDTIGDLSSIYHIARLAYVGGGFDSGIHNILEPASFHIPVIFGPNYQRFEEAVNLQALGCVTAVENTTELSTVQARYSDEQVRDQVSASLAKYLRHHSGATEKIYAYIRGHNFLEHAMEQGLPR